MSTRFTALTVREGDAFLLEDNGWKCLFDSGRDKTIVDLLNFKGIDKLDLAICSHNDADHADGFIELLKSGIQIKEIWLPGLWANVLQFIKDNYGKEIEEVEWNEDYNNGDLDSLFSDEVVEEKSFNQSLSFFVEMKNSERLQKLCNHLHGRLVDSIILNPDFYAAFLYHNLKQHFNNEYFSDYLENDLRDYLEDYLSWMPYKDVCYLAKKLARNQFSFSILKDYCMALSYLKYEENEHLHYRLKHYLDFKLNRIIDIATLAKQHVRVIRWFEPTSACSKEKTDYGFVSLNSSMMCSIKMPKSSMMYLYTLSLTKENKYSLVFEYTKNDFPLIRFSADSNCSCQSVSPYPNNIIVTAPHHGSAANAMVYKKLKGDDIIWIRSDKMYYKRPCQEFKQQQNKYCLACQRFNFISEICFEYNTWYKKWDYIRGERCRCK